MRVWIPGWLHARDFLPRMFLLLLSEVWGRRRKEGNKWKQTGRDRENKTLFVSTLKLCLSVQFFQAFFPPSLYFFYCAHPAIQHLSLPGWMNSSIQKDYFAELGTGSGMGQRAAVGGGGACVCVCVCVWGEGGFCMLRTLCKAAKKSTV